MTGQSMSTFLLFKTHDASKVHVQVFKVPFIIMVYRHSVRLDSVDNKYFLLDSLKVRPSIINLVYLASFKLPPLMTNYHSSNYFLKAFTVK